MAENRLDLVLRRKDQPTRDSATKKTCVAARLRHRVMLVNMDQSDVIVSSIAGLLQVIVAVWAFRLTKVFGTTQVGWSLFTAFSLLALAHLIESTYEFTAGVRPVIEIQVVYALISLLLIVGLAHIENVLKERQRMERQAKKLELIGQLTAGVAHDFNNILTVLRGYADLLTPKQQDPDSKEQLRQIYLAVSRCGSLNRHLLLFSRRQEMQVAALDLNTVIKNLVPMLRRMIDENINLKDDYCSGESSVMADIIEVEQIIMNLAVNARDAMPNGGILTIGTAAVTVDEAQAKRQRGARSGDFVCLRVNDTGTGMPSHVLSHIYEPFFTTKGAGKGTGLGLATVLEIVQRHSGWIDVRSQVGRGTEFKVYLPAVSREKTEMLRRQEAAAVVGGTETILLVEDEGPLRELTGLILKQNGYQVIEADCGSTALSAWDLKSSQIDLLVSDIVMPGGISGYDLADHLKKARPGLGVVFTSGYELQRTGQGPKSVAGSVFVPKPYTSSELLHAVRACLVNRDGRQHSEAGVGGGKARKSEGVLPG